MTWTFSDHLFQKKCLMVSVLAPFINSSLEIALLCVSFEALSALQPAFKAVREFSFANFLSFAFCNAFSLLCFNNFFLSMFIVYIFVVLPFLVFTVLALFLSSLVSFLLSLFHFFLLKGNHFICIIITCIFINLFYRSLCMCMFYWGFSQIYTVWSRLSLLSMIQSTCGVKFLFLPISS